jgi:methyl-accepting chemotaxis protein
MNFIIVRLQTLNCSVRYKLGLAFSLLLICFIFNGVSSFIILYNIKSVEEEQRNISLALDWLQRNSLAYQSELSDYAETIFITNSTYINDALRRNIANSLIENAYNISSKDNQVFRTKLAELFSVAFDHFALLESLINQGDLTTARTKWQEFSPNFEAISRLMQERQTQLEADRNRGEAQVSDAIFISSVTLIGISGFSIVLVLILLYLIEQALVKPLNKLQQALKRVAEGELNQQLEIANRDEIGRLTESFKAAVFSLGQVFQGVQISEVLQAVTSQLSAVSKQQAAGSSEQVTALTEVIGAMHEMGRTAAQIADNSVQVVDITNTTLTQIEQVAEAGNSSQQQVAQMRIVAEKTLGGVEHIGREVTEFVRIMGELYEQTEMVGKVVGLINSIASEVHLLALNAAIEAAGAGEYGERFRAVAQEVKQLANRTGLASQDAHKLINQVQLTSQTAKTQIEKGLSEVEAIVIFNDDLRISLDRVENSAQQVGVAVTNLLALAGQVGERALEIQQATYQQRISSEQVIVSTRSAEEVAEQTLQVTQQVTISSVQLENLAHQLNRVLGQVKLAA